MRVRETERQRDTEPFYHPSLLLSQAPEAKLSLLRHLLQFRKKNAGKAEAEVSPKRNKYNPPESAGAKRCSGRRQWAPPTPYAPALADGQHLGQHPVATLHADASPGVKMTKAPTLGTNGGNFSRFL